MEHDYNDPELGPILELANPDPADDALVYGCGVGQAAFALAACGSAVQAVDDDAEVLREAERLATELGLQEVMFRRCDLYALGESAARFNLVVARMVLHRLIDPAAALAEMRRVLAPGGRIVIYEAAADEASDRHFNELARLREPAHWRHYRPAEYLELFHAAGLRVTDQRVVRRSVDMDYWIEAAQAPRRNADLIRARVLSLPVPVQAAMDVAFSDRRISLSYDVLAARLEPAPN